MQLARMKVHKIKESFVVYVPITWARGMELKKGDTLVYSVEEGDLSTLHLRKE